MLHAELRGGVALPSLEARLEVATGRCLALVGPSGAGKTTLLRLLAGLLRPGAGRIECGGELWLDTDAGVALAPERRRCGFVFQDYALFGHMAAWRQVAYARRDVRGRGRREAAVELLARLGIADRADARPAELSGGERQRLALARALASRPRALLLDEPLSALDARTRARATRVLLELLAATPVPAVLVTHDFDEAAAIGDELAVIEAGRIVQRGSAEELTARPASAFVADLTGAVVLAGSAVARADGLTEVALDGGGAALSADRGAGRVAISVHPWEITLARGAAAAVPGSARNRLPGRVSSLRPVGNRYRIGIDGAQPLVAEITAEARRELGLEPGTEVIATWKATATRIVAADETPVEGRGSLN